MNLKLLVSSHVLLSLVLSSCYTPRTYRPDYMVNAAVVCDYDYRTPIRSDDCEYVNGYYYHPGSYHLYWRPMGRPAVVVYDNYRFSNVSSYSPGSSVRLNQPIATSLSGEPVRDGRGRVRTAPKGKDYGKTPLSSNPKQPSSYKPTLATPTNSTPPRPVSNVGNLNKPNGATTGKGSSGNGTTGNVKSGSSTKPSNASRGTSSGSTGSGSSKSKATSTPTPVRSKSSGSFSKSPSRSSSTGSSSRGSSSGSKASGSSRTSGSKASGRGSSRSVRGGSFGSSRSSGG